MFALLSSLVQPTPPSLATAARQLSSTHWPRVGIPCSLLFSRSLQPGCPTQPATTAMIDCSHHKHKHIRRLHRQRPRRARVQRDGIHACMTSWLQPTRKIPCSVLRSVVRQLPRAQRGNTKVRQHLGRTRKCLRDQHVVPQHLSQGRSVTQRAGPCNAVCVLRKVAAEPANQPQSGCYERCCGGGSARRANVVP